jgi:primase-polymerase (primpol)-like protein
MTANQLPPSSALPPSLRPPPSLPKPTYKPNQEHFKNIPNRLTVLTQWICWRYEWDSDKEKWNKTPYRVNGRDKASTTTPHDWSTFEEAVKAALDPSKKLDGIGFVFTKDDPYAGIDLDMKNPEDEERQFRYYEELGCYAERSVGGEGCHVIVEAVVREGKHKCGIEVYSQGRYFAFTGDASRNEPITNKQDVVNRMIKEIDEENERRKKVKAERKAADNQAALALAAPSAARNGSAAHTEPTRRGEGGEGARSVGFLNGQTQSSSGGSVYIDYAYAEKAAFQFPPDAPQTRSDVETLRRARSGKNGSGEQFNKHFDIAWKEGDPKSPSENDSAFTNHLVYYTQNHDQLYRIFLQSVTGREGKCAHGKRRDYVWRTICDSLIRRLNKNQKNGTAGTLYNGGGAAGAPYNGGGDPYADEDDEYPTAPDETGIAAEQARARDHAALLPDYDKAMAFPCVPAEGLFDTIFSYIKYSSFRVTDESALVATLSFMSAICGSAYCTRTGMGLNSYLCYNAGSASGKEAILNGVTDLFNLLDYDETLDGKVIKKYSFADTFLAKGKIRAAEAIGKEFTEPFSSRIALYDEFGDYLASLVDKTANPNYRAIKTVISEMFMKSTPKSRSPGGRYSKSDDNVDGFPCPAFSISAVTTQHTLYPKLSPDSAHDGLLGKFMFVEYSGPKVRCNNEAFRFELLPRQVEELRKFACFASQQAKSWKQLRVQYDETSAVRAMSEGYEDEIDRINAVDPSIVKTVLWGRARLYVLKFASIAAISRNHYNPVMTVADFCWARRIVEKCVFGLVRKFETNVIGSAASAHRPENRQRPELAKIILKLLRLDDDGCKAWKVNSSLQKLGFLSTGPIKTACAKNDAFVSAKEINLRKSTETAIDNLPLTGCIKRASHEVMAAEYAKLKPAKEYRNGGFIVVISVPELQNIADF